MYYYLLFVILMPALIYVDYLCYKKRMGKLLEEQPDFDGNRHNYDGLLEKMCAGQKRTSILACAILCLAALVLGVVFIRGTGRGL